MPIPYQQKPENFQPSGKEAPQTPYSIFETNQSSQRDPEPSEVEKISTKIEWKTILAITVVRQSLAFTYEAALLSFVLPTAILSSINADIGPSGQVNWISTAWSLAGALIQTIAGRCGDIFGRRNFILAGNLLALIGCTLASRASSINTVIIGMTFMGIGSGSQQLSFACVNEIVPKSTRGKALAFLNLASLPGSAFGSVIAYALVSHMSWRWAFYVGIIANGLALLLTLGFYWPKKSVELQMEENTKWQKINKLDFLGLLLFGGGLGSFLLGISFGNNPYLWQSVPVISPLLLGGITLFFLFPAWEIFGPKRIAKLCPPDLFRNLRGFTLPLFAVFVSGMLLISLQTFWPQEVQSLFTTNPELVGWYSLSYNAASTMGSLVSGSLFSKIRHTRWQYLAAVTLQTIFTALMATVNEETPEKAIIFVAFAAFGIGASQIIGILTIQFGATDDSIGIATGLAGSMRSAGGAVAIAIYGSIIKGKTSTNLVSQMNDAARKAGVLPSAASSLVSMLNLGSKVSPDSSKGITSSSIAATINASQRVYSQAFRFIYLVSIAFGLAAVLAVLFVPSVDKSLTRQKVARIETPEALKKPMEKPKTTSDI